MHAHKHDKKRKAVVQRKVSDPLDFDQVESLLQEADDRFSFVRSEAGLVWLVQNRDLLEFIDEKCETDLWTIGTRFDHLEPPSLRNEFGLPPPL